MPMSKKTEKKLLKIAKKHTTFETLETSNVGDLDFQEVSVWGLRDALEAAYKAGNRAGRLASKGYIALGSEELQDILE